MDVVIGIVELFDLRQASAAVARINHTNVQGLRKAFGPCGRMGVCREASPFEAHFPLKRRINLPGTAKTMYTSAQIQPCHAIFKLDGSRRTNLNQPAALFFGQIIRSSRQARSYSGRSLIRTRVLRALYSRSKSLEHPLSHSRNGSYRSFSATDKPKVARIIGKS